MAKSKRLDPAEKAHRAAERKRVSDEKKAARAAEKARKKAEKEANRPYSIFVSRQRFKPFDAEHLDQVGQYDGRMMGPTEHVVSLSENLGAKIGAAPTKSDLIDGREVKHVEGGSKSIISFRSDITSKRMERDALEEAHVWLLQNVPPDEVVRLMTYLKDGIKSNFRTVLPQAIVDIYDSHLHPARGLSAYSKGIVLTVKAGRLEVAPEEYDSAFRLATWTNGDVKYALSTAWLRSLP